MKRRGNSSGSSAAASTTSSSKAQGSKKAQGGTNDGAAAADAKDAAKPKQPTRPPRFPVPALIAGFVGLLLACFTDSGNIGEDSRWLALGANLLLSAITGLSPIVAQLRELWQAGRAAMKKKRKQLTGLVIMLVRGAQRGARCALFPLTAVQARQDVPRSCCGADNADAQVGVTFGFGLLGPAGVVTFLCFVVAIRGIATEVALARSPHAGAPS